MRILLPLLVLLALPLAEIAAFVAVGTQIGLLATLVLVVASFALGLMVVRRQSLSALHAVRAQARSGRVPEREIAGRAVTALGGLLMMVPGLITSAIGLLLVLPPVRDAVMRFLGSRVVVRTATPFGGSYGAGSAPGPRPVRPGIVDLEEDEFERRGEPDPRTPWSAVEDRDDRDPR